VPPGDDRYPLEEPQPARPAGYGPLRYAAFMSEFGRQWRDVQEQIRVVLNTTWDPLGVGDMVDDEYDSYIGGVYVLVREGASPEHFCEHLRRVELESLEIAPTSQEHKMRVLSELKSLNLPILSYPG